MGVLLRKYRHSFSFTGMARLSSVLFLASLGSAFIDTIWAVYLEGFFHNSSYVGLFSGFLSALAFVSFFFLVPFVQRTKKSILYGNVLFLTALLYLLFSFNRNFVIFIFLSIILTVLIALKISVFGIMVKDKSNNSNLSRNEGLVYSFNNVAWLIGPLFVSLVLLDFGHSVVFLSSTLLVFLAFFLFKISGIRDNTTTKRIDDNVLKNFFEYFKSRERIVSYLIGAGVTTWWALIYLYIPLYIIDSGLKEYWIGVFLFACALPLILFEYMFSKMAGKYGSKKLFLTGYSIVAIISLAAFFASSPYVILGMLVFGSVGLAMLEPTCEAYFFRIMKSKRDEGRFYGPYNTAIEVGLIFGKVAPAILLIFLPFRYIFLLFSAFMLFFFFVAMNSKNIVEGKKN